MSMLIEQRTATPAELTVCAWEELDRTYRCRVILCPEEDGGFSALAQRLPGVVSQGETEDEALRNISEAFRGAVQMYLEDGGGIPWQDSDETALPKGSKERWVLVDV